MSFISWRPLYNYPLPEGHRFPMLKYELIHDQLLYLGIVTEEDFIAPSLLNLEHLHGVHSEDYRRRLLNLDLNEKEVRRIGLPVNEEMVSRELHITQGTITAAENAIEYGIGFNVAGGTHHAGSNWGEGFCMLNDQAVAARYLLNNCDINQILIIDLDVHQGNGTAEIFEKEERVFTFSMHGENNFPFKKEYPDLDVGLPDGTNGEEYMSVLIPHLEDLFLKVNPDFVFYQAGVDVLESDRMGRLKLTHEDCKIRDRAVFNACLSANVPVQVSMGGGYSSDIKKIVNAHCQTFEVGMGIILQ